MPELFFHFSRSMDSVKIFVSIKNLRQYRAWNKFVCHLEYKFERNIKYKIKNIKLKNI